MRDERLPDLAGGDVYNTGPNVGAPTKIAPPSYLFPNGKIPGWGHAAQWQNYIEATLQRQIERSAQIPFRNWIEYPSAAASGIASYFSARCAYSPWLGATFWATSAPNVGYYLQDFYEPNPVGGSIPSVSYTPASGTFQASDVVAMPASSSMPSIFWIVGGSNGTAPTKSVFHVGRTGNTEITLPVSGGLNLLAFDRTAGDGRVYGLAADTNRSVLIRNFATGVWTVVGTRGSSAVAPTSNSPACFAAAAGGVIGMAYPDGSGNVKVDKIVASPFSVTSTVVAVGSPLGLQYSPARREFVLMYSNGGLRVSSDLVTWNTVPSAGGTNYTGSFSGDGGCLHDTGRVGYDNTGNATYGAAGSGALWVESWLGYTPHVVQLGQLGSSGITGVAARFDGSAIWFMYDKSGTKRLFRSLRA